MTQAVIYARVSTDEQAEKGYSLPFQLSECRAYAERNNMEVVQEITDDFSGATLNRPGFSTLQSLLESGRVRAVIVHRQNRLSRDAVDFLHTRKQWMKKGIELHYVDRGKAQFNFEGMLMDGLKAFMIENERTEIIKATKNGRREKARSNKMVMSGIPPYGYKKVGKREEAHLVIDVEEAEVVSKIFDWYIYGDSENAPLSLRAIAMRLDDLGTAPPGHRKRIAKHWYPNTIKGILCNEIYVGVSYYNKIIQRDSIRTDQPKEKWIRIDVPELAFIDRGLFDAVQERAHRNWKRAIRNQNKKRKYFLTGHITCGNCGIAVIGNTKYPKRNATPIKYYRCGSYTRHAPRIECKYGSKSVNAKKVDDLIWEWLVELVSDEFKLDKGLNRMLDKREQELTPRRERLHNIEQMIEEFDGRLERLIRELSNHDDDIVLDAIRSQIKDISKNRDALESEKRRLQVVMQQDENAEDLRKKIKAMAVAISKKLTVASFEKKRQILDLLDVKVKVYREGKKVTLGVSCLIPPLESHQNKHLVGQDGQEIESIVLLPL